MKAVARFFMILLALLFIGGALFIAAITFNIIPGLADTVNMPAWVGETVMLAAGSGLLLLALILLAFSIRRPSVKARNAVLQGSEYGEILISLSAVENMVLRVIQQINGIKDVSRDVAFTTDGLVVRIKISVMPDVAIPAVISELQAKTKEYLEEITGIKVQEVKVTVEDVNMDQAASKTIK